MAHTTDTVAELPTQVCGYPVDSALSDRGCYLAIGPGGRGVAVKRMEEDCILKGQLHPAVRERLERVREIAHGGVANLFGVERDAGAAWLVWEYLPGESFDLYAAHPDRSLRDLASAGRELALAVDLLHAQGIVHGAVHGNNVIVSPAGAVRLTHVSPLLYDDPDQDADAVAAMLESAVALRGGENSSLGWLLARARQDKPGLRALAARLAALIESRELEDPGAAPPDQDHRPRRRAMWAAATVAVLGAAAGVVAWRAAVSPELRAGVQGRVQRLFAPANGPTDQPPAGGAADGAP
jgi:hypothetical protein